MSDEDTKSWIYAGGLPYELSEGDIVCVFSQYGEILEISLSRDRDTGKSRGFCFIKYEDPRSCELAVDNLNGASIVGRKIKVSYANNTNAVKARRPAFVAPQEGGTLLKEFDDDNKYHNKRKQDELSPSPPRNRSRDFGDQRRDPYRPQHESKHRFRESDDQRRDPDRPRPESKHRDRDTGSHRHIHNRSNYESGHRQRSPEDRKRNSDYREPKHRRHDSNDKRHDSDRPHRESSKQRHRDRDSDRSSHHESKHRDQDSDRRRHTFDTRQSNTERRHRHHDSKDR